MAEARFPLRTRLMTPPSRQTSLPGETGAICMKETKSGNNLTSTLEILPIATAYLAFEILINVSETSIEKKTSHS